MSSELGGPRPPASARGQGHDPAESTVRALARGADQASVMSVELLGGIGTWMAIGWLADRWLDTGPWLMVAGALLGNAAGLYLIWLRGGRATAAPGEADASGDGRPGRVDGRPDPVDGRADPAEAADG
ncbi:MAG: AtpZ/AtpI family protein [Actinomycetota bacterium]